MWTCLPQALVTQLKTFHEQLLWVYSAVRKLPAALRGLPSFAPQENAALPEALPTFLTAALWRSTLTILPLLSKAIPPTFCSYQPHY